MPSRAASSLAPPDDAHETFMASVEIQNVRKSYGPLEVVHGVSLHIPDGAFVVLLGPSGCGKSTLLRMIAGLEKAASGDIKIGGRVVNDAHPKDRDIAMVFQNYALYAHMTVFDNMSFSMNLRKAPRAEIEKQVKWASSILGLDPYLDRLPRQLSGGQRQRVAMGRAIVRNPAVFLFDEPLSNLDAKLRVQMRTEIKELHQRLGSTTVYVTHDQIEAMTMADVIVILRDGEIEQVGKPLEIYDSPANLFVAEFIGSPTMNLMQGEMIGDGSVPKVNLGEGLLVDAPPGRGTHPGQKVVFGIRPEHLRPTTHGPGLRATVNVLEPTGAETHIYAKLGQREVCAITSERLPLQAGETAMLTFPPERAHLFDAATGVAIRG
jgi:multiple sugar transport system ATP-binding protein